MTVREIKSLLFYGTNWQLVGAKTGKKLCDNYNKKETIEKYMDLTVSDTPIIADFSVRKDSVFKHTTDYMKPMITILVSGK